VEEEEEEEEETKVDGVREEGGTNFVAPRVAAGAAVAIAAKLVRGAGVVCDEEEGRRQKEQDW
jgi:hypothetical protein